MSEAQSESDVDAAIQETKQAVDELGEFVKEHPDEDQRRLFFEQMRVFVKNQLEEYE